MSPPLCSRSTPGRGSDDRRRRAVSHGERVGTADQVRETFAGGTDGGVPGAEREVWSATECVRNADAGIGAQTGEGSGSGDQGREVSRPLAWNSVCGEGP